jgi:hypothetical protein
MKSRLFHTIVVCGAALRLLPLGCAADAERASDAGGPDPERFAGADAGTPDGDLTARCILPDGSCGEHCSPLADGGCLDPCFVHTTSCSPDCLRLDGSCGWPPTK